MSEFNKQFQLYQDTVDDTDSSPEAKLALLAEQVRVDMKKVPPNERQAIISFLSQSKDAMRLIRRQK